MKSIFNSFMQLSVGLKVLVVSTAIVVVAGIGMATYMITNNNENVITTAVQGQKENKEIPEDKIQEIPEETIQVADEVIEEEKEEEKVKYGDKEIKIPKAKVASVNEKEDAQTQKTGGEQMSAAEAVDKFENDGKYVGIDVSKHQGVINWAAVKNSGIEFAIIRVGFRGQTAGSIYEDTYFKRNINGAVSNGIKVGIYFYSCAVNEAEALEEAAWVVNMIKSYRITYPVVYDFEDFGRYRCSGVSGAQATSNAIAFLNYVRSAGYTPMMYANKNDITNRFNKSRLSGYKFWLAHYTSATNYTGKYDMWQYTSNGSVAGISGRVDMNVAYFGYGAVAEPKHTHDFDNGKVISTSDSKPATCTQTGVKYIRCASCSESKKVTIPVLKHKYGGWVPEKEATTEEAGLKYRECSVCKHKDTVEIPKLEDTIDNTVGNTTGDNTQEPVVPENTTGSAPEHVHSYTEKTTESTCTVKGKTWKECTGCGEKIEEKELDLIAHDYGDVVTGEDGSSYKKCIKCGHTETVIQEQTGEENIQTEQ